jgi:hypothetical protein
MEEIPRAKNIRPTYENFIASCPWCGRENIFDRASDLKDFDLIDYCAVTCLFRDCGRPFYLNSDVVNSPYEMLIWDCYELLERKHYAYYILNLAQAFEAFFSQYLRIELLYRPFASDSERDEQDIKKLNELERALCDKMRPLAFHDMQKLFFCQILRSPHPSSLREAEGIIRTLPSKDKLVLPPVDHIRNAAIFANKRVPELLVRLMSFNVSNLRNRVVHKSAYRPTLDEVNDELKETRAILFPLGRLLDVRIDNVNCI